MDLRKYRRNRRSRAWHRKLLLVLPLFFVFLAGAGYVLWGPYFTVNMAEIILPPEEGIDEKLEVWLSSMDNFPRPLNNFFFLSAAEVSDFLVSAGLAAFEVEKTFPRGLKIIFLEKTPRFIFCGVPPDCFYADETGLLLQTAPNFGESPLPVISILPQARLKIGDAALSPKEAEFMFGVLSAAKEKTGAEFIKAEIMRESGEMKFFTKNDWYLFLDLTSDYKRVLSDFKLLLDEKIKDNISRLKYVDMRFENKAFYKFK